MSKGLDTEKCKVCVVNDREPNVMVTNCVIGWSSS